MKPKWLVEDFDEGNNYGRLIKEIKRQGYECEPITYYPIESGNRDKYSDNDCVIVQASLQLAGELIRSKKGWIPGPWLYLQKYECSTYYAHLGEYLFNDDYIMLPASEFKRTKERWYERLGKDGCIFIRPSSGFKTFDGKIFTVEHFDKDWEWVEEFADKDSLIVISSPKNIKAEWRFVVAEGEVVAGSMYRENGKSECTGGWHNKAFELAKIVANKYSPDPIYVIDVCQGADNEYYLLEIGSFSCAGLYACDMKPIVETASRLALNCWNEIYSI